ncbi:MAG: flagellar motor switch protein FliG [Parvularculaceae bacterium]
MSETRIQKTVSDPSQLTGPERAAVVMLALGEEASRPLWATFDEDELRELSRAIATLGSVAPGVVDQLLYELVGGLTSTSQVIGSAASAQRLLKNVLPEDKADLILEDIRGPAGKTMWDKLANVNERILCGYLQNEHPQTIAVILSRIKREHAARVLAQFPALLSEDVIGRMLSLGPVQKEVLDQIETTLRTEFMAALQRSDDRDPLEAMAEIFNHFDRATERRFLTALENKNPGAAARIKDLMFVFEDLVRLDGPDMQALLRRVDKSVLALALKGARDDVATHFFMNMSERAATILRDDIAVMGPVRLSEVDLSQQKIVSAAKQLAEEGEIYLSKTGDEELVY